mmetsp:Transcript_23352/g.43920  ORF Transcript_23352/g.43920 Transcript_23352/m.43920 type:complete len:231 (+) Transcript_23352:144-836(+)
MDRCHAVVVNGEAHLRVLAAHNELCVQDNEERKQQDAAEGVEESHRLEGRRGGAKAAKAGHEDHEAEATHRPSCAHCVRIEARDVILRLASKQRQSSHHKGCDGQDDEHGLLRVRSADETNQHCFGDGEGSEQDVVRWGVSHGVGTANEDARGSNGHDQGTKHQCHQQCRVGPRNGRSQLHYDPSNQRRDGQLCSENVVHLADEAVAHGGILDSAQLLVLVILSDQGGPL